MLPKRLYWQVYCSDYCWWNWSVSIVVLRLTGWMSGLGLVRCLVECLGGILLLVNPSNISLPNKNYSHLQSSIQSTAHTTFSSKKFWKFESDSGIPVSIFPDYFSSKNLGRLNLTYRFPVSIFPDSLRLKNFWKFESHLKMKVQYSRLFHA